MQFTRGFSDSRKRVSQSKKFLRSCTNCEYYYKAMGDKEERCQNPNVLTYDLIVEGNNVSCGYWKQCKRRDSELFKSTGREE